MNLSEILGKISIWIVFLPMLVGLCFIKSLKRDSIIIYLIVLFASIPQFVHGININKTSETIVYNLYSPIEFFLISLLFKQKLISLKTIIIYRLSIIIYLLIGFLLTMNFGFRVRFLNELVCLGNLIYTVWILMYILEQYFKENIDFSLFNSFTIYTIVLLFYAPCTLLVFALWHLKIANSYFLSSISILHSFFNILLYVGFTIGFIVEKFNFKNQLKRIGNFHSI